MKARYELLRSWDERLRRVLPRSLRRVAVPVFFDAVEDKVRLRTLTAVTFVMLFSIIFTVLLTPVLRDPLQLLGDDRVWTTQIVLPPPPTAQFGVPFNKDTLIRVVNFKGNGVQGAKVTLGIQRVRAPAFGIDVDCTDLQPTLYNLQYRFVCDANLTDNTGESGSAGFAALSETTIQSGVAGSYNLSITSESVTSYASVTMESQVFSIFVLDPIPSSVAIGEEITFTVLVLDEDGLPLAGRSVVLLAPPFAPGDLESLGVTYVPDYRADKFGIIQNSGDRVTDLLGKATIRMRWKATNYALQYPVVLCERVSVPLFSSFASPMRLTTNVSMVKIIEQPPTAIEEMMPFSTVVGVYDSNRTKLSGKIVIAQITLFAGAREAPYLSKPRVNSLKKLYYATSEPSGADGLARFTNLTFNQQGSSGEYRITFFCDGIASNESSSIDVKTSVKTVIAIWETQDLNIEVGKLITTLPSVYVLGEMGQPILGKQITAYSFNTSNAHLVGAPIESLANGIATFGEVLLTQGLSRESLSLSLFVDGVASRLPVALQLDNVTQDPSLCRFVRLTSGASSAIIVGRNDPQQKIVVQAVNYAGQPLENIYVVPLLDVDGQYIVSNSIGITNATGYAELNSLTVQSGFTQVSILVIAGFQVDANSTCVSDLYRVQVLNPVHSIDLVSVTSNTSREFLIEYEVFDEAGEPLNGLEVTLVLLAYENYVDSTPPYQLYNYSVVGEDKLLLSIHAGYPGDFRFALKVAGIPGPQFNVTIDSAVSKLTLVTQHVADPATGVARLGIPFTVQPVVLVQDEDGNPLPNIVVQAQLCDLDKNALVGDVNPTTSAPAGSRFSLPSDSNGRAVFPALGFIGASPGDYTLCFWYASGAPYQVGPAGPSAALRSVDLMHVTVVQQPSSTASVGVPLAAPPTIQVYAIRMPSNSTSSTRRSLGADTDMSGYHRAALKAFAPTSSELSISDDQYNGQVELLQVMVGSISVDGVLSKKGFITNPFAATKNGNLTFSQMAFTLDLSDYAYLKATVPGGSTSLLQIYPIQIVEFPSRITIIRDPPATVYVGQSFYVSVTATISSGSPLADHMIQAELDKTPENSYASLDYTTAYNITDSKGVAQFHLIIKSGVPGTYSIRFRSVGNSVTSQSSAAFKLLNAIQEVQIVEQPDSVGGEVRISDNTLRAIDSLRQPRLRVVDPYGRGLPGRVVQVLTDPSKAALRYNQSHITDDEGYYQFTDLHFVDGTSGDYSLIFVCQGITVKSQSFYVYNELEPDRSFLQYMSYFVYAAMALVLPLFFANSSWVRHKYVTFGFLVLSFLMIGGCIVAALVVIITGYEQGQLDPYLQTLRIFVIIMMLLPVVPYTIILILFLMKRTSFFHYRARKTMFWRHTVKLLQSARSLGIPPTKFEKEAVMRQREEFLASLNWQARLWAKLKTIHKDHSNWHAPLEGRDSFFYPQRFIVGMSLSLMILFYVFVAAILLIYYVIYLIVKNYNRLVDLEARALQHGSSSAAASEAFGDIWASVVSLLVRVSINIDKHLLTDLRNTIFATGLSAAIVALVLCLLILFHYCRSYRNHIMKMRQGIYPVERTAYGLPGATSFMGTVMNHTAAGYLAVFLLVWIFLFVLSNRLLREMIWDGLVASYLLQKLATASFIISICLFLFRFLVVGYFLLGPGGRIRHRRWFAVADYINTFLSALGGIISVVIRLITAIGFMLLSFIRLDMPAIGSYSSRDPGYSAWMGLLISDARYNNPAANVFADLMLEKLARLREEAERSRSLTGGGKGKDQGEDEESVSLLARQTEEGERRSRRFAKLMLSQSDDGLVDASMASHEDIIERREVEDDDEAVEEVEEEMTRRKDAARRRRARNRWFLLYTLIKNPQLRGMRKRTLDRETEIKEEETEEEAPQVVLRRKRRDDQEDHGNAL